MAAFTENPPEESFDYLQKVAEEHKCLLSYNKNLPKILRMNEKGENGVLACLCKVGTSCPCNELDEDLKTAGKCYCGIFWGL